MAFNLFLEILEFGCFTFSSLQYDRQRYIKMNTIQLYFISYFNYI